MDLNSLEHEADNQKLSIKKRFLRTNSLFKKELKKIKDNLIKERIQIDSLRYISIIEYQNIQNNLNRRENKKVTISKLINHNNFIVDINIPKLIKIKLFLYQIISLIRWLQDSKRSIKLNILIMHSVAEDLLQHINKKKKDHNLEIIIPAELIIFSKKKLFKNIKLNPNRRKIEPLKFYMDKLYEFHLYYHSQFFLFLPDLAFRI